MDGFGFGIGGSVKMESRFPPYGQDFYQVDSKQSDPRFSQKQTSFGTYASSSNNNPNSNMQFTNVVNNSMGFFAEPTNNYVYSNTKFDTSGTPGYEGVTPFITSPTTINSKLEERGFNIGKQQEDGFLTGFETLRAELPRQHTKTPRKATSPKQAVRLPPRVDAFGKVKRSRKGCLTCRHRKKRCCETKPRCYECQRLDLPCKWPAPGTENKNRSKSNPISRDEIKHEVYGTIKVLRGIIDYKFEG